MVGKYYGNSGSSGSSQQSKYYNVVPDTPQNVAPPGTLTARGEAQSQAAQAQYEAASRGQVDRTFRPGVQPSSLSGSTAIRGGVLRPGQTEIKPANKLAQTEAVFSKQTATGQFGEPTRTIPYRTIPTGVGIQQRTQTIIKPQSAEIGVSEGFAKKAVMEAPQVRVIGRERSLTYDEYGNVRPQQRPVYTASLRQIPQEVSTPVQRPTLTFGLQPQTQPTLPIKEKPPLFRNYSLPSERPTIIEKSPEQRQTLFSKSKQFASEEIGRELRAIGILNPKENEQFLLSTGLSGGFIKSAFQKVPSLIKSGISFFKSTKLISEETISKVPSVFTRFPTYAKSIILGEAALKGSTKLTEKYYGKEVYEASQETTRLLSEFRGMPYELNKEGKIIGFKKQNADILSSLQQSKDYTQNLLFGKEAKSTSDAFRTYSLPSERPVETIQKRGIIESFALNLPLAPVAARYNKVYSSEETKLIEAIGRTKGISEEKLPEFVKQTKQATTVLQSQEALVTAFTIERAGEIAGARQIVKTFIESTGEKISKKELTKELFKKTAPTFLAYGTGEGMSQYYTQYQTRGGQFSWKDFLISGAMGGVISLGLGGGALAYSATKPVRSKILYGIGQAIEFPYEAAGDILASQQKRITKKLGYEVIEPGLAKVIPKNKEPFYKLFATKSSSKISIPSISVPSSSVQETISKQSNLNNLFSNKASVKPFGTDTFNVQEALKNQQNQQQEQQQTIQEEQKQQQEQQQKQNEETRQRSESRTEQNIQQTINENININTQQNIPIGTNVFGLRGGSLGLPLIFPPFMNGGLSGGGNKKVFTNELFESQKLFREQLGFNIGNLFTKVKRRSSSKRKK